MRWFLYYPSFLCISFQLLMQKPFYIMYLRTYLLLIIVIISEGLQIRSVYAHT